jgi:tetratricopeptide (TPR) repeat protein
MMRRKAAVTVVAALLTVMVGCNRDPVAASKALAKRGDQYLAQKKPGEAVIEYRKAIAANPRNGEVRLALAKVYVDNNDLQNAFNEYVRAADLLPENIDAQLSAGRILLVTGRFEDAKTRADKILTLQPRNIDAQILKGNALAGLKDLDGAIAQVEIAISNDPSGSAAYSNLGVLQFAKGDTAAAELAFKRAVITDPTSVNARLALANYYWSVSQKDKAEGALKETIALAPKNLLANRSLALFYLGSGRKAEAEQPLKVFSEVAPAPAGRLALADYYASMRRYADAKAVLERLASEPGGMMPAKLRLVSLGLISGDRAEAYRLIADVLQKDPKQLDALVGKARLQLTDGKLDDASATAKMAINANPNSPQAHYVSGTILLARDQREDASTAFKEALRLNPAFAPAQVALAKLSLANGKNDEAIQYAQNAIQSVPGYAEAYLLLAQAHLANNNPTGAEHPLKILETALASNPVVQTELGRLYLAKGNRAGARAAFDKALEQNPTEIDAIQGVVAMDLQDHNAAAALARIEAAQTAAPQNAELRLIAARVYATVNDLPAAERSLKKALETSPNNLRVYEALARVYAMQQRLPEATAEFEKLAQRQPKATAPLTLAGVLLQLQHKPNEAKAHFQKALEIDPRAAVAANNLAWLYAEGNENLDIALQLAQTAKAQLPDRHEVDDTLGWVYYKKGLSTLAVAAFQRSVQLQPDNASYVGHLGLAYAQNGDKFKARQSLERALTLKADFDGADEARKVLKSIGG